jgi:hypothetical protein
MSMRKFAWAICVLASSFGPSLQAQEAGPEKSEVPPSHSLGVIRMTLDGLLVIRQPKPGWRIREYTQPDGVKRQYYAPTVSYVDRTAKLADLRIMFADGTKVDEAILRKRLVEPAVVVLSGAEKFELSHYRHCKSDTLVVFGETPDDPAVAGANHYSAPFPAPVPGPATPPRIVPVTEPPAPDVAPKY